MDSSVIVLDSDDEDIAVQKSEKVIQEIKPTVKRTASSDVNGNGGPSNKIRRIIPTKVGEVASKSTTGSSLEAQAAISRTKLKSSENLISTETKPVHLDDKDQAEKVEREECSNMMEEVAENKEEPQAGPSTTKVAKNILTPQLEQLIKASRTAEASIDMKLVIKNKLLKYYHMVHPDFVTSKTFLKSLKATTDEIVRAPHLVYASLKVIIDELDARRKCKATIFTTEESLEVEGTGDEAKDARLKILYKALVKCKRTITDLEEAEVDWEDDDNSSYLKKVRFEKRACEIYHKICEITGESAHAHRIVKKPITFKGNEFPEFYKQLQKMVNKKNEFPNFRDVSRVLDYCNKKYNFGLKQDHMKKIAQDAFEKLGKLLQQRRKTDLYETTTFYVGKSKDPAKEDPELRVQLEKNKKNYAKYDDIINEFADREDKPQSDAEEVSSTSKTEPAEQSKEPADETPTEDHLTAMGDNCDKNGTLATTIDEADNDLVILS